MKIDSLIKMRLILFILLTMKIVYGQTIESPCPSVFSYELVEGETDRWYGVVKLYTAYTLHGLWLNIILDKKADILGNWVANTTTKNNIEFKIENPMMKINPTPVESLRFFVKYSTLESPPKVKAITLNGKEICDTDAPLPIPSKQLLKEDLKSQVNVENEDSSELPVGRPIHIPKVLIKNSIGTQSSQNTISLAQPNEFLSRVLGLLVRPEVTYEPPVYERNTNIASQSPVTRGEDNTDVFNGLNRRQNFNPLYRFHQQPKCGRLSRCYSDNTNAVEHKGRATMLGQWPWQVALYRSERWINKYQCGGTLITPRDVVVSANCVTHRGSNIIVDNKILSVHLGKHNLRVSEQGTQIRLVSEVRIHEEYDAIFFSKNIGIVKLREPAEFTDWVQPVCLWPENQEELFDTLGKNGSVVGWKFNEDEKLIEELSLIEMPIVDDVTCLLSKRKFYALFTSEFTFCAGGRNGASFCNGNSGGGMMFKVQGSWYLRGLFSLSVPREDNPSVCDPRHYLVFTDVAKLLPWIKQHIHSYH